MTENSAKLALLAARLPRYTSFPPANRFQAEVGAEARTAWLAELAAGEQVSLYVHIPYCRRLCWFCACSTKGTQNEAVLETYLDDLETEIGLVRSAIGRKQPVSQLHLGGGTPTFVPPAGLRRLAAMLRDGFDLDTASEVSVEIDPCEFDREKCEALKDLGLSRASIGVQDFDPVVQKTIGREQGIEATTEAVRLIRDAGVESLNVDLLYGLPHQDRGRLLATLDGVLSFAPDRIALYGYAHVPWVAKRQKLIPEDALPSPEERLELAAAAREHLVAAGYKVVGIDHFAMPDDTMAVAARSGHLRRNFQGYTTDEADTLIGIGASAISRFRQGYSQNIPAEKEWRTALRSGALPVARGHALTDADRVTAGIIETLMCSGTADIGAIAARHGQDPEGWLDMAQQAVGGYPDAGTLNGSVIAVADMAYARLLASGFDDPKGLQGMRYSMAS